MEKNLEICSCGHEKEKHQDRQGRKVHPDVRWDIADAKCVECDCDGFTFPPVKTDKAQQNTMKIAGIIKEFQGMFLEFGNAKITKSGIDVEKWLTQTLTTLLNGE